MEMLMQVPGVTAGGALTVVEATQESVPEGVDSGSWWTPHPHPWRFWSGRSNQLHAYPCRHAP